ncbi:unnamed protein product [Cuscuta epithymum]|uniref:No apical meristem-associated C-terminal domain-containing protein n=1 Tax=Cuscuta epithymum TaxID=186058 RepID=A0AAV0CXN7_9ASTE|nr:unnamed protein product [Cuscuta epithymum]CAH9133095.1 unnamed protein product [Cuscuta epithymum]
MDHEFDPFPSSQNPTLVNYTSQAPNQFSSISPQFQPTYQFNPINGSCSPYTNLPYGPPFSFQNHLSTPIFGSGTSDTPKASGGGRKKHKDVNSSQCSIKKREDWSSEEDIALTNAWLHISMDADVGNNQKSTAMWERILQVWRDNMGERCNKPRNNNSLQCRWQKIQKAVNKFHAIYEKLERHPQSGSNTDDMAMRMYEKVFSDKKKKEFKYIHCWELLIMNPKWCTSQLTKASGLNKSTSDNKTVAEVSETSPIPEKHGLEPEQVKSDGIVRPLGRKSCKDRKRKLNSENGVIEVLNKIQCSFDKQIEFNKVELEMKKENQMKEHAFREELMKKEIELKEHNRKLRDETQLMKKEEQEMKKKEQELRQRRADQDRVMSVDLSRLPPSARATCEILQAQILKEWEIRSTSGI